MRASMAGSEGMAGVVCAARVSTAQKHITVANNLFMGRILWGYKFSKL
jgi:hypothetical protein